MTRRYALDLLLTATASTIGCSGSKGDVLARLNQSARTDDYVIIDTLIPEAITVIGTRANLTLPEPPGRLSLAPDGSWLAWLPYRSNVYGGDPEGPVIHYTDNPLSARILKLKGRFAARLAISSKAEHLAVALVEAAGPITRLIVLKTQTGEIEYDVTDLITRFSLRDLERLRLSARGDRLVVGSLKWFSLIDLPSRRVLFEGAGRFASISPSGEFLAFVDARRKLSVVTVAIGETRHLLKSSTTHGVGSWTPDGTFLFAGLEGPLSFSCSLAAVDCLADAYANIASLDEHDSGQECAFMKRHFLTADKA